MLTAALIGQGCEDGSPKNRKRIFAPRLKPAATIGAPGQALPTA
jgi:hypothetical protein